jgi:mono/diheme cytochrome c family protein
MKFTAACLSALLVAVAAQNRTTQDGIYSEAQAKRGDAVYAKSCASCHGSRLEGDAQAPALADKDFAAEWNDQPLSDLFERIRTTMPGDAPGTLKPEEVADVAAFILNKSGMPAGQTDLPHDVAALKPLTFKK